MKRRLITVIAALAVIAATLCMGLTMTACKTKTESYKISVVYADGTPVNGLTDGTKGVKDNGDPDTKVLIQICAVNPDTEVTGFCNPMLDLGADGKLEVKKSDVNEAKRKDNEKWHVNIVGLKDGYTFNDIYLNGYGSYTVTVTAQN